LLGKVAKSILTAVWSGSASFLDTFPFVEARGRRFDSRVAWVVLGTFFDFLARNAEIEDPAEFGLLLGMTCGWVEGWLRCRRRKTISVKKEVQQSMSVEEDGACVGGTGLGSFEALLGFALGTMHESARGACR
jgi:hypothetical protein